jgi:hypothetical protein
VEELFVLMSLVAAVAPGGVAVLYLRIENASKLFLVECLAPCA